MAETRTWLTTPAGRAPAGEGDELERWVPGPSIPAEPRLPSRFRGVVLLAVVYAAVVGLTFALVPTFLDVQDPTFAGDGGQRLDQTDDDPTFERPRSN